jgi:hypothetical protein
VIDPPPRPDWRSEITTAQFGPMAEDLLAVSLEAAASGSATIARPIVDRGVDLYLRRIRSLLTIPIQVKAFQHLSPDGNGSLDLPVTEIGVDPQGHLAMVHVPAPHDQLYRHLFLIPFRDFRERCPRGLLHGAEAFTFTGNFLASPKDLWTEFLFDIDRLPAWLASIEGWTSPIPPVPHPAPREAITEGDARTDWLGDIGRLWTATELERAGAASIVIAEDRVRLDTVTLLVHDLASRRFGGLHIRTGQVTAGRTVHFEVTRPSFFIDPGLNVVLVLLDQDLRVHDFCLVIPSQQMPELGYSETITVDPLTKRFEPYRVASDQVGTVLLSQLFRKD